MHFLGDFLFTLFGCLLICSNNIMYTCLGISASYSLIRVAAADDDGGIDRLYFLFASIIFCIMLMLVNVFIMHFFNRERWRNCM